VQTAGAIPATPTAAPSSPFVGSRSLRVPRETESLIIALATAPLAIVLVGLFFHGVTVSEVALLVVVGLVLVSLARGRLLGNSVRIDERQFPQVFADVSEIAADLGVRVPLVFVRDDPFVPLASLGTEEPYALVISSQYFEHLRRPELRFLIARELAHIAAGHTRISSIFSASGRENPFVSILFGSWLRKTEYTADRAGLLFCDSLEDAISAIAITTFHSIGRHIDYEALAAQQSALEGDGRLRLGEWSSAVPFATNRIKAIQTFANSELAGYWRDELRRVERKSETSTPVAHGEFVRARDCASPVRRFAALTLDLFVVSAILESGIAISASHSKVDASTELDVGQLLKMYPWLEKLPSLHVTFLDGKHLLALFLYFAVLVALSGQTLGMMIAEVRVVNRRFEQAPVGQVIWRYVVGGLSAMFVVPAFFGLAFRIQPHDRLSRTRVVRSRLLR
jgi:Zn-dependent protease with chaperone function